MFMTLDCWLLFVLAACKGPSQYIVFFFFSITSGSPRAVSVSDRTRLRIKSKGPELHSWALFFFLN